MTKLYRPGSKLEFSNDAMVTAATAAFASWAQFVLSSITLQQSLMAGAMLNPISSFCADHATLRRQRAMLRRSQFYIVKN